MVIKNTKKDFSSNPPKRGFKKKRVQKKESSKKREFKKKRVQKKESSKKREFKSLRKEVSQ
ncbi:hypothetical protein Hpkin59_04950 [Helicobacter pylori]